MSQSYLDLVFKVELHTINNDIPTNIRIEWYDD